MLAGVPGLVGPLTELFRPGLPTAVSLGSVFLEQKGQADVVGVLPDGLFQQGHRTLEVLILAPLLCLADEAQKPF